MTTTESSAVVSRLAAARRRRAEQQRPELVRRAAGAPDVTATQQRLWFLWKLDPTSSAYNLPIGLRLSGDADPEALAEAVRDIADRHEVLRTAIAQDGQGLLAARVLDASAVPIEVRPVDSARAALASVAAETEAPFDLAGAPPMRGLILPCAAEDVTVLVITFHHIAMDAVSEQVVLDELDRCYTTRLAGTVSGLDTPTQYDDAIRWLDQLMPTTADDVNWWAEQLRGLPTVLELPTDRRRGAEFTAADVPVRIEGTLAAGVRELARQSQASPFMVLLAAWAALLGRLADADDVPVGVPVAGRPVAELGEVVGCFLDTVVMRVDVSGQPTGTELIHRVRETCLAGYAHARTPFDKVVEAVAPERGLGHTPIFQSMLNVYPAPPAEVPIGPLTGYAVEQPTPAAKYDLNLAFEDGPDGFAGELTYRTDLFQAATAQRIAGWFEALVAELVATPHDRLGDTVWPATPVFAGAPSDVAPEGGLHRLIEHWATATPEATALRDRSGSMTYGELEIRANQVANALLSAAPATGRPVALLLDQSCALPVAMLAAMKAGVPYLPLDTTYPRERLALMLATAGVSQVVTDAANAGLLAGLDVHTVLLEEAAAFPATRPDVEVAATDLLHVIFTSGSTGTPKGIETTHANVIHYLHWMLRRMDVLDQCSFAVVSTPAADFGLTPTFGALTTGGVIHLLGRQVAMEPAALADYLDRHPIDVLKCVPSHLELLAGGGDIAAVLPRRLLVLGGEACPWDLVHRVRDAAPGLRVQSHYGHTESTMISLTYEVTDADAGADGIVPLGEPLPGVAGVLIGRDERPRPEGCPGELIISGPGIARGYLGAPELTAAKFGAGPFGRTYRTGDELRRGNDGQLRFLGRTDDQVKIRGFRVELGDVTSVLRAIPGVAEAVVLASGAGAARQLHAWITADAGVTIDPADVRRQARRVLPEYAVPTLITTLDAIPLNPNGKIDRAALVQAAAPTTPRGPGRAPTGPVETAVAAVWREILDCPEPDADGDFFVLGGHSFAAARVAARLAGQLGHDVPIRLVLERPILHEFAAAVETLGRGSVAAEPIPRRAVPGADIPLPPSMARLWFLAQFDQASTAYLMDASVRITGPLDADALIAAIHALVARHDVFRATFHDGAAGPVMRIADVSATPVNVVEATRHPAETVRAARDAHQRPFELDREPPIRVTLCHTGIGEYVLLVTIHHVATDNWSRGIFGRDLAALYAAQTGSGPGPEPLDISFADAALWLTTDGAPDPDDLDWWCTELAAHPLVLRLPTDRPRPRVPSGTGADLAFAVTGKLADRVRGLAASASATPFVVYLTAWCVLLGKLADTDDVLVGVPEAGRVHPDIEDLIGCFIGTLVMRGDLRDDPTVRDALSRVRAHTLQALGRSRTPFEQIVERLVTDRDTSTTPIFQAMMNLLDSPAGEPTLPGVAVETLPEEARSAKVDLELSLLRAGRGYEGVLGYRPDLFDESTVERIAGWYLAVLEAMTANPAAKLRDVALDASPATILGPPETSAPTTIPALFETWVDRAPDAVAVVAPDGSLTYAELETHANRLAKVLIDSGVSAGQPVGVLLEQGVGLAAAIFGVQKAGGVYLPFDTGYPLPRTLAAMTHAGARIAVTNDMFAQRCGDAGLAVVNLERPGDLDGAADRPTGRITPDDLTHIIFTSGSTGAPKGVTARHANLTARLSGLYELFGDSVGGSFAVVSTPAADFGLTCVYGALSTGGSVHLIDRETASDPEALAGYLATHRIDVLKLVPSHLELLATHGDLRSVLPRELLIVAGEACPWSLVERVRSARPELRMQSHYGHTESTMISFSCDVDTVPERLRGGIVPVGRPLPGVVGHLVDRHGRVTGAGIPGELIIGGPGVTAGYLGNPELTADRFIEYPPGSGARCYRTGDLLRVRVEDDIAEFLGRVDDQVQIKGHRVELGEVVTALLARPEVAEAVVLPAGEGQERHLLAWVVARAGHEVVSAQVREALRVDLPNHMVPTAITTIERMPLNANGKIDRAKLPDPDLGASVGGRPPESAAEREVAAAWSVVLGREGFGADDDFFAAGGTSFDAVRVVRTLGHNLRVIDLFMNPTVARLAALIEAAEPTGETGGILHRLSSAVADGSTTLVAIPYGGGSAAVYRPLASALEGRMAVVAAELPGHDPARPDEQPLPVADLVDRLAVEIEASVAGPIAVYGHCVGSAVAVALARRLEDDGRQVDGVFVAGSFPQARDTRGIFGWLQRKFPRERWISDKSFREELRATGGLPEEIDDVTADTAVRALRHDSKQAQEWFGTELAGTPAPLRAPILCLVGERDQAAEMYQERFREWGAFASGVDMAVIPRAGHYFLNHQAEAVGEVLHATLEDWRDGIRPDAVSATPVVGHEARRQLRSFYFLAFGQLISMVGSALSAFALAVWAYQQSNEISDLAWVILLTMLPTTLITPIGGALADRIDRRRLMMASLLGSGASMTLLAALTFSGRLTMGWALVVVTLVASFESIHTPAYLAGISQLVPKPYLPQANAFAELGIGIGSVTGPLFGGLMMGFWDLGAVLLVDAVTFAIGLGSLLLVRFPDLMFVRREESFRRALSGGWRFIVRRRPMRLMVGYFAVVNYFTALMWVGLTPMVLNLADSKTLGVIEAAGGVGAVVGAIVVMAWGGTRRRAEGMVGFVVLSGLSVVIMGLGPSVVAIGVGLFLRMACMSIGNAHWLSVIQTKVGIELQGRVLAVNMMLAAAIQPLGILTVAPLADRVIGPLVAPGGALAGSLGRITGGNGLVALMLISGVCLTVWGLLGMRTRDLRYLEDALPDATPGAEIGNRDAIQEELDRQLVGSAR